MQKPAGLIFQQWLPFIFMALFCFSTCVKAEEHGSEGGAAGTPYEKLEPFTVNLLGNLHQVAQVSLTLKPVTLTIGDKIKLYMPVIRNNVILLLSGKTPEQLTSLDGKQKLILETRHATNQALGMTSKNGIADVLLESLVIQ